MRHVLYKFCLNTMKRWTRAGIIQFLDSYLDSEENETILVIGGKGPILNHILNKRNLGIIKTLDINPDHHADYTIDIADHLLIEKINKKFDKIIAIEVLEHVTNYISALRNIHSLLKEKGTFIASTPWVIPLHDVPNDFHRFTWYEISRMLDVEGFNNVKIESRGNFFDSILALGVRGFLGSGKYSKLTGLIFILITTFLPLPKRYGSPQYSCIGYNFSATH